MRTLKMDVFFLYFGKMQNQLSSTRFFFIYFLTKFSFSMKHNALNIYAGYKYISMYLYIFGHSHLNAK